MLLESVRALKERLLADVRSTSPDEVSALGVALDLSQVASSGMLAIGIAPGEGRQGFKLALRFTRPSPASHAMVEQISNLARRELDVQYVGRVTALTTALWQRQPQRPLLLGSSIAHYRSTAGTLGAFVRRPGMPNTLFALSNNHVLANEDQGLLGDDILQPGPADGGAAPHDRIGALGPAVQLQRAAPNMVDCALAEVDVSVAQVDPRTLLGIGHLQGKSQADLDAGLQVRKVGRTTGLTSGSIRAFDVDGVRVKFGIGHLTFDGQVEIEGQGDRAFSDAGDSGSLIVDAEARAVALLFAGTRSGGANNLGLTYANPIDSVLSALQADLIY